MLIKVLRKDGSVDRHTFPNVVWEPTPDGWVTRPVKGADIKRREELAISLTRGGVGIYEEDEE